MRSYIPKHKNDFEAVTFLKSCSFCEIKKDVPKLLENLQDSHWEIAHQIGIYFIPHINKISSELLAVLESNDNEWKFGVLFCLIMKAKEPLNQELISVLTRISDNPTDIEKEEELNIIAKEIIMRWSFTQPP